MGGGDSITLHYGSVIKTKYLYAPMPNGNVQDLVCS